MAKIILVGNYKGCVGKTTAVINLADAFSSKGFKVLTVDLDPQSSLSEIQAENFHQKGSLKEIPDQETLNYCLDLSILSLEKYPDRKSKLNFQKLIHNYRKNYDYVLSSLFYQNGKGLDDLAESMEYEIPFLSILRDFLFAVREDYDFIFLDCPPTRNNLTKSAFLCSDFYLVPTILDKISTDGVLQYIYNVEKTYREICEEHEGAVLAKNIFGDCPKLLGVFWNRYRANVNYTVEVGNFKSAIAHGDKMIPIFDCKIHDCIDIVREAQKGRMSNSNHDFAELARTVLERIKEMDGTEC